MHSKTCGKKPGRFAITADAQVDGIRFKNFATIEDGINLAEALRIGANQVLEMDPEGSSNTLPTTRYRTI